MSILLGGLTTYPYDLGMLHYAISPTPTTVVQPSIVHNWDTTVIQRQSDTMRVQFAQLLGGGVMPGGVHGQ